MASMELIGISAIVITPFPTAVASDVNDNTGVSESFKSRNRRASFANTGPIINSGALDNAPFIALFISSAVSKNFTLNGFC